MRSEEEEEKVGLQTKTRRGSRMQLRSDQKRKKWKKR